MQQVESFCKSIDELLVLCGIFTQVNLCLTVARILIILATFKEVSARFIIMLIKDWKTDLICKLPSVFKIRIAGV